jgi:hypothetical protein
VGICLGVGGWFIIQKNAFDGKIFEPFTHFISPILVGSLSLNTVPARRTGSFIAGLRAY